MVLMLILALVCTPGFCRKSRELGLRSGRIACIPVLSMTLLLMAGHVGVRGIESLSESNVMSPTTGSSFVMAIKWLIPVTHLAIISVFWKALEHVSIATAVACAGPASSGPQPSDKDSSNGD